jgi:hypothetical protein
MTCSIRKRIAPARSEFFFDFVILSATDRFAKASRSAKSKDPYPRYKVRVSEVVAILFPFLVKGCFF